ncbi:MAG: hypothetical protein H0X66_02000 [Verrucomicrobia bacterium]|nr:hypothetical protein [Verrucomicrobiota bacterium]
MKPGLELDKVVLLGRTLEEYTRYFGLTEDDLRGKKVLDVASGVSSFTAEARERGYDVTAFDLIYQFPLEEIQAKCEPDLDYVTKEIGKVKAYKWEFYKSPEGMRVYRERAYKRFLEDYRQHRGTGYIFGKLPQTPFSEGQFDLTLVSYLLFVYDDHLDYAFHKESILELLRITRGELRLYPLVNFRAEPSKHFEKIKTDPDFAPFTFEEFTTDFEFLTNSNRYLKIRRRA